MNADPAMSGWGPDASATVVPVTQVLGVPIANLGYEGVIDCIARWIAERSHRYIGVCPVHSVIESVWHPDHRKVMNAADLNTADGMPVVWAQKMLGHRGASRVYGPTLMLKTLARAEQEGWRVAFHGGHPDRLQVLLRNLERDYPELQVVHAESPPFRPLSDEEDAALTRKIRDARPDLIWVGLGCPKQERWMFEHSPQIPGVMLGVGAAFDFHAGAVRQSPRILQKIGMEWAFRLYCEPRRLFKRYATTNPTYLALLAWQLTKRLFGARYQQALPDAPRSPLAVADAEATAQPADPAPPPQTTGA